MCGVCLHSFCVAEANREIEAAGAEVIEGDNLCSVSCYRFRNCMVPNALLLKAHVHAPTSIGPHQQLQVSTTTT